MIFNMVVFGKRIQKLRMSRKLSQAQLAMALNVSTQYICNIESGQRRPSIDIMVIMADYFHVSLDYLILGISSHRDQQKQMQEELARGLKHLAIVVRLLKQLS